jgi:hypothetical protein
LQCDNGASSDSKNKHDVNKNSESRTAAHLLQPINYNT